jgi:hypothetical protein
MSEESKEIFYWELNPYGSFSLFKEGERIYGQKITIRDVEKHLGKDLKVRTAGENGDYTIEAKVIHDGEIKRDYRKKRGRNYRVYQLKM